MYTHPSHTIASSLECVSPCMYLYLCVCVMYFWWHACVHTHIPQRIVIRVCISILVSLHTCISIHLSVSVECVSPYLYLSIHVSLYIYLYLSSVYLHVHVSVSVEYTYTCICICRVCTSIHVYCMEIHTRQIPICIVSLPRDRLRVCGAPPWPPPCVWRGVRMTMRWGICVCAHVSSKIHHTYISIHVSPYMYLYLCVCVMYFWWHACVHTHIPQRIFIRTPLRTQGGGHGGATRCIWGGTQSLCFVISRAW